MSAASTPPAPTRPPGDGGVSFRRISLAVSVVVLLLVGGAVLRLWTLPLFDAEQLAADRARLREILAELDARPIAAFPTETGDPLTLEALLGPETPIPACLALPTRPISAALRGQALLHGSTSWTNVPRPDDPRSLSDGGFEPVSSPVFPAESLPASLAMVEARCGELPALVRRTLGAQVAGGTITDPLTRDQAFTAIFANIVMARRMIAAGEHDGGVQTLFESVRLAQALDRALALPLESLVLESVIVALNLELEIDHGRVASLLSAVEASSPRFDEMTFRYLDVAIREADEPEAAYLAELVRPMARHCLDQPFASCQERLSAMAPSDDPSLVQAFVALIGGPTTKERIQRRHWVRALALEDVGRDTLWRRHEQHYATLHWQLDHLDQRARGACDAIPASPVESVPGRCPLVPLFAGQHAEGLDLLTDRKWIGLDTTTFEPLQRRLASQGPDLALPLTVRWRAAEREWISAHPSEWREGAVVRGWSPDRGPRRMIRPHALCTPESVIERATTLVDTSGELRARPLVEIGEPLSEWLVFVGRTDAWAEGETEAEPEPVSPLPSESLVILSPEGVHHELARRPAALGECAPFPYLGDTADPHRVCAGVYDIHAVYVAGDQLAIVGRALYAGGNDPFVWVAELPAELRGLPAPPCMP